MWLACSAGLLLALALAGCSDEASEMTIPVVYVVAGKVVDPTTSPVTGIPGASVQVETSSSITAVTTDADGAFILQGVPAGNCRLSATLAGHRQTVTSDFRVGRNVSNALLPIFTDHQIDSVLVARGAPAWDRDQGLFGLFALKSTGVPLGDVLVSFSPSPGGTLVQTGEGKDPIVVVNGVPGDYDLTLTRSGYAWDVPYNVSLRPGVVTFAAPRARPNLLGFVFADHANGSPVGAADVSVISGFSTGTTTVTNFLGQFSLVGLAVGPTIARIDHAGFYPTVTWPQPLDQDTTLALTLVHVDTLAAWSSAQGGPIPAAARGHLQVEVHDVNGGARLDGATVQIDPTFGAGQSGGAAGSTALAQTSNAPAVRLNLAPGLYRVFVHTDAKGNSAPSESVLVRTAEITQTRLDY